MRRYSFVALLLGLFLGTLAPQSLLAQNAGDNPASNKAGAKEAKQKSAPSYDVAAKKRLLQSIKDRLTEAGKRFKAEDFDQAAALINQANKEMVEVSKDADAKLLKQIEPVYERLERAHQLLSIEGVDLDALPDRMGEGQATEPEGDRVQFTTDIAPWLTQQCSRCHGQTKRGGFSLASFADLMKGSSAGVVLFPGDAKASRIVEVIETGDMPRGGGKVSPENLQKLKDWINQGADFDGQDPAASLANPGGDQVAQATMEVARPTGSETVSFAKDVVPLLLANCNGCHLEATQIRGGLRMDNFTQLLKGGDSGAMLDPSKASESLLLKKLRGLSGQRMPGGGRPALPEEKIKLIETWIAEGARFDGDSPDSAMRQVANLAWVSSATDSELRSRRVEDAKKLWEVAVPKLKPFEKSDDQFIVLGTVSERQADTVLATAKAAAKLVRKQLKIPEDEPLLKGGVVLFVFTKRYDYGEFGKMAENRSLPAEWNGHWRKQTVNAYVSLYHDPEHADQLLSQLTQSIAGVYLGAMKDVPRGLLRGWTKHIGIGQR